MKQETVNTQISTELLKALALCQFNNEEYFVTGGKAYEGTEKEALEEFSACQLEQDDQEMILDFSEWCAENKTEIEETDSEGEKDNYLILTDEEADEKAADYIKDSLWAFNAPFLSSYTDLPEEVFTAMQDKCEGANDTFYTLIERSGGIKGFIEDAISADGRGHFMSSYDGCENEETVYIDEETGEPLANNDKAAQTFYIYRIN